MNSEQGKSRNKSLALLLSVLPGTGHMYLGLLKQGTQFMLLFFSLIFFANWLDIIVLEVFIPVVWLSSLFDCLSKVSSEDPPEDADIPFVKWLLKDIRIGTNNIKYIGYLLIVIGVYFLIDKAIIPQLAYILTPHVCSIIKAAIVSILLIAGGIKLLLMSRDSMEKKS